eukprot:Gregarina_sp_Poly_1__10066@NODE_679_length_6812_cov_83_202669_g512_i0_p1_GENE_NODE_679_length_6812_cov_83_202669_g512_i0NODE_679_length_6812_cov_83_202669_g512_i0_p1_ORF_typecomplete_len512_score83_52Hydrolase/PF00702_26/1_2e26Cation_ATPase/PF13246_6/1_7e14Hydrolase_3/PF08282_12/1_4e05HAD/PF12710_7/2_2HAD/PF12710_7/1_1e03HAD/PF12710_7/33_NODE_679_length_6812_cov_83_202669_g512_i022743809
MTDKTGTLTANVMELRKMAIGATSYGEGLTQMRRKLMLKAGLQPPSQPPRDRRKPSTPHVNCESSQLRSDLEGERGLGVRRNCMLFLLNLAINHSVLIDVTHSDEDGSMPAELDLKALKYIASSPDEEALVNGARHFDVIFVNREGSNAIVRVEGISIVIEIIAYFEFTSDRKRSTLICKISPNNCRVLFKSEEFSHPQYYVFLKGADTVVLPRCRQETVIGSIHFLKMYAEDCLRTLCLAYSEISSEQLDTWYQTYLKATMLLENREDAMLKSVEQLEQSLTFQGVTGIEDKLAPNVGKTIQALLKAGIKVWMLTGDRFETAMNIGLATELVPQKSQQILLLADRLFGDLGAENKSAKLRQKLQYILASMEVRDNSEEAAAYARADRPAASPRRTDTTSSKGQLDVVSFWDGEVIRMALQDPEMKFLAYQICRNCRSVVFFRVAPQEKGNVVRMVKEFDKKAVTLAVGDGANDCNMIQTAHVGVGIKGKEGLQAFSVEWQLFGSFFTLLN